MSSENTQRTKVSDVREQVHEDDRGKWDLMIDRPQLTMRDGSLRYPPDYCAEYPNDLIPSPWAITQICGRLGIPAAYFKRCPKILRDQQFNYWVRDPEPETDDESQEGADEEESIASTQGGKHTQWLLRAKHNRLRGVLGERYAPLDNARLMECLIEASATRMHVGWFSLTDESLHLRLIDPGLAREVLPADKLQIGIHIGNSEVGKRAITVDAMVFREVCTNGLIRLVQGKSLLYRRHIHLSEQNFMQMLQAAMHEALNTAATLLERLRWATGEPVRDVETTIQYFGNLWDLSQRTQELVKLALLGERADQQETLYGLVNAFTNAAQKLAPDERYRLEVSAGRLLEQGLKAHSIAPIVREPRSFAPRRGHLALVGGGERGGIMLPSRLMNGTVGR